MNPKTPPFVIVSLAFAILRAADESSGQGALNQLKTLPGDWEGDGAALRMTHFCAVNQPRWKAGQIDLAKRMIDFDFVDVSTLRSPDARHVRGLEMHLIDPNRLTVTFLFQSGDKESRENIILKRVKPS